MSLPLAGTEHLRHEDHNWYCGLFTWAYRELRKTQAACAASPTNKRLAFAAKDTAAAISERLESWDASNGPH